MYARSTTVRGNPQSLDQAIDYIRDEVMPAVQQMAGCIGMSVMCERDTGRCIATTAWQTEEAMHDSESGVHDLRMRMADMMGGSAEVQEWEIAMLHRMREAPEGACCRVVWIHGDPAKADDAMTTLRTAMLPRLEELPGFCSVSAFVDRDTGRGVTATVYESRDAMNRAAEQGKSLRESFTREMGMEISEVGEFELAMAHLRVPETV
jgi:heme-degrading monooxygenase HmoA